MPKAKTPKLTADQFTDTQWSTAADKAKFGNQLIAFIDKGFPRSQWTKAFYKRLSLTFGHIAHYDQAGFWSAQLCSPRRQLEFLINLEAYGCYGDPTFTFSDVERQVIAFVRTSGAIEKLRAAVDGDVERAERAQLARLSLKYAHA